MGNKESYNQSDDLDIDAIKSQKVKTKMQIRVFIYFLILLV